MSGTSALPVLFKKQIGRDGIDEARAWAGIAPAAGCLVAMIQAMLLALLHGIVQFLLDVLVQHQKAKANLRIDAKFTTGFDEVFRREGVEVIPLPYRAPRANSFADRFVGTARRELLDHVLICGQRHLEHVLGEFIEHSTRSARIKAWSSGYLGLVSRRESSWRADRCWVAFCTNTYGRLLELPIVFVERHTGS